jgi:phosphoserine aminotransferase
VHSFESILMRYFTPGPTQLHPRIPEFLNQALRDEVCSWSHRSPAFDKTYAAAADGVKKLLGAPDKMHVFFLGSAAEAMERIVQNCAARNTLHFVNGAFSERFYQTARELGKNARAIQAELGEGFDFNAAEIPQETELICLTQNETSTGVMIPIARLAWVKRRCPNAFLALDIVSSAPYPQIDFNFVDCCFFSVQKCFGLPAGLGVLLVNDAVIARSLEILASGISIGCHHNFPTLLSYEKKFQTPATPNVLGIYLLARVAEDYLAQGINKIRQETDTKAQLIYELLDQNMQFGAFVADKASRSTTVVTVDVRGDLKKLLAYLRSNNIEVGAGYGKLKDSQIRIANFPMHTAADIAEVCDLLRKAPTA